MVTVAAKKTRKRVEILNSAKRLFARFGLKKTSLDDIAHSIGMAKTSLYYYFKSKGELFNAVIKDEGDYLLKKLEEEINHHQSPPKKLKAFLIARLELLNNLRNLKKLINKEPRKRPRQVEKVFNQFLQQELTLIESILHEGVAQRIFRPCDSSLLSIAILTLFNKLETATTLLPGGDLQQEDYHQVIELLFNGLLKE